MELRRARVVNFRAISDVTLELGDQTTLLGPNGVGKSCVLKAIDRFFSKSANVTSEDFNNGNTATPIEITLTFDRLTADENEVFAKRIHGGELSITRVLASGLPGRDNGKYYGLAPRHAAFQGIRSLTGAVPRREAYNALRAAAPYDTLATATNDAAVLAALDAWESQNPALCALDRDDGQFFGFTNVGRGLLQKYISFVFVPAIRDASADSLDRGTSVISQLIELIVKAVVQKREDFKKWQAEATAEYAKLVSPENLGELANLSGLLTGTLNHFYNDTAVQLSWMPPEGFQVALPAANVALTEQGYTGPVEGKGHGLQRAFIFTILQHLAGALQSAPVEQPAEAGGAEVQPVETSHTLILAIEEPELYQHPTKQRHLAQVLSALSTGRIEGVVGRTQIVTCSHSPYFVAPDRFAEVRIARRSLNQETGVSCCAFSQVTNQQVCEHLNQHLNLQGKDAFVADTIVAKLHILDPLVAEGFFADVAVLVEGAGDRAALTAAALAKGYNLEAEGIAIIPVNGKSNLSKPLAIFGLLGVPCFTVFDSDLNLKPEDRHPEVNLGIQRLSGVPDPVEFRTYVGERFASYENCLEDIISTEVGDAFDSEVAKAQVKYGLSKKRLLKSPVSLAEILVGCAKAGHTSETLADIVDAVVRVKEQSC